MSFFNTFYYADLKKLPMDFFKAFDAHVRAGSKEDFISDIQTAIDSKMLPAFTILLRHAIAVNEDVLDCDFLPPGLICPLQLGELSDLIFKEMLKESKASYYLLNSLKACCSKEKEMPGYMCFWPYLKLWRAAVFSENKRYFDIVLSILIDIGIDDLLLKDSTVIFYLIRKERRKDILKIADIIGADKLIGEMKFFSPGSFLTDNFSLTYYMDHLFEILIPKYACANDKKAEFCRLFEKYEIIGYLTKIISDNSGYYYLLGSIRNKKGCQSQAEKKIIRMAAVFFRELAAKGYKLCSKDVEKLLRFSDFSNWDMIMEQEPVIAALGAVTPEKLYLPYSSELLSSGHPPYSFERAFSLLPIVVVFDESILDEFSNDGVFSNILHKNLNTLKKTFGSIKTAIKGDLEKIPVVNEILERNDSAVLCLLNSLEELDDDIISELAELCVKKGCLTTLSHISKFAAERKAYK
ncbi:MAG: hypothetical protein MSJ26_02815 [Oscillospiraceae bacterium]|nr:hypothetical protein [Oscillospiraceae bacterium]